MSLGRGGAWVRRVVVLAAAVVVVVVAVAAPERGGHRAGAAVGTAARAVQVLEMGGVVLPPQARVGGVRESSGRDRLWAVVVVTDEAGVVAMLEGSGFAGPLESGRKVFLPPVEGVAVGGRIASAQDRRGALMREVLVDRSDPVRRVVHWWLFTT